MASGRAEVPAAEDLEIRRFAHGGADDDVGESVLVNVGVLATRNPLAQMLLARN